MFEVFLLQVTKVISIPHHMEWSSTIQIPHTTHHWCHHTWNECEIKLELWSYSFTYQSSWGLISSLLMCTFCGIMSQLIITKTFNLRQVLVLFYLTIISFGLGFIPFPLLCLSIQGTILLIVVLGWGSISGVLPYLFLHQFEPRFLPIW